MRVEQKAAQDLQFNKLIRESGFPASYRLQRKTRFDHVFHGSKLVDQHFRVYYVDNDKENARLGLILNKRLLPRAIDRNSLKRSIREIFRKHVIKNKNLDIVVQLKTTNNSSLHKYSEEIFYLFNRLEDRCTNY